MNKCKRCGDELEIHEHHTHPKFMDNKKGYGLKILLCKKCHITLHLIIPSIIWKYIKQEDKYKLIKDIENYTLFYCKENIDKHIENEKQTQLNNTCGNIGCDREVDPEDYIDGYCPSCDYTIKSGDDNVEYNRSV